VGSVARALASRHEMDVTGIDILEFNLAEATRRSAKGSREFYAVMSEKSPAGLW
jgi:2-polyprenyl-3-methyl-5-hydroxy-6-metoxy-1,4-benzoquinol methylase